MRKRDDIRQWVTRVVAATSFVATLLVAGCSTTPTTKGPAPEAVRTVESGQKKSEKTPPAETEKPRRADARMKVSKGVGFTIVERAHISAQVREEYQTAVGYLQNAQYERGIKLLQDVMRKVPDVTAPYIDLGIAYNRSGDLKNAEASLKEALMRNPQQPVAYNELGLVYRKMGQFEEARESYEKALAIYPRFQFARKNLAILCDLYLADMKCALKNYQVYSEIVPDDAKVATWIEDVRERSGAQEEAK